MQTQEVDTALGRLRTCSRGTGEAGRDAIVFWPSLLMTSDMWAAQADAIPGARFVVLDGVAHLAALENPTLVNRLVADFLTD